MPVSSMSRFSHEAISHEHNNSLSRSLACLRIVTIYSIKVGPKHALAFTPRLGPDQHGILTSSSVSRGAVYDALVAASAVHHKLPLVSRDRHALDTEAPRV